MDMDLGFFLLDFFPPKEALFWLTSDETDMLAFVWLRGKRGSRTERCSVWGVEEGGRWGRRGHFGRSARTC